jgi:formate dehydrogenase subunit gamma
MSRFILLLTSFALATNSQSDERNIWRQIREGVSGYSAVNGQESEILIQASGTQWLTIRNELIAGTGAWMLALTVLALAVFFLIRGRVKLTEAVTGEMIERWSKSERWLHFYTASLFILLALTGLSLLYGRSFLISWLGHDSFSQYADIAKIVHNYAGPLFSVGLVMMGMIWFQDNLFNKTDITWFKQYGGMIGNKHPSAGRMNAGEKAWFWLLMTAGVLVSITGMNLDFPNLGQYRLIMQISHIIHSVSAFLLIIGALVHIYIGTIGTEGALQGMITGKVDKSWAKQHHDLWYQQLQKQTSQNSGSEFKKSSSTERQNPGSQV